MSRFGARRRYETDTAITRQPREIKMAKKIVFRPSSIQTNHCTVVVAGNRFFAYCRIQYTRNDKNRYCPRRYEVSRTAAKNMIVFYTLSQYVR